MTDKVEGPVVDLGWIFYGPIEAVIRANIAAAEEFVEFLERYGFVNSAHDPDQVLGELRMVTFSFEQPGGPSGLPVKRLLRAPALSFVPLPLLEVKHATFEFGVRVLAAVQTSKPPSVHLLRADGASQPDAPKVKWRAMLAPGKATQGSDAQPDLTPHLAANVNAKVTVGQADIPAGIRNLLAVMGENAQMIPSQIVVQPQTLNVRHRPDRVIEREIVLKVQPEGRRSIVAYYPDGRGISLVTSASEAWPSGQHHSTDETGLLKVKFVWHGKHGLEQEAIRIMFATTVEGSSVVAETVCIIEKPPESIEAS